MSWIALRLLWFYKFNTKSVVKLWKNILDHRFQYIPWSSRLSPSNMTVCLLTHSIPSFNLDLYYLSSKLVSLCPWIVFCLIFLCLSILHKNLVFVSSFLYKSFTFLDIRFHWITSVLSSQLYLLMAASKSKKFCFYDVKITSAVNTSECVSCL